MPSEDITISVRNLTKSYRLFDHPGDRIKQFLSFGLKRCHREFNALSNVSFDILRGQTIGIIGRNGSGKSTLLQLVSGILKPTAGEVVVNGRISALLELGSGFNPEFTGRENVYFQGVLMGFKKPQMDERFDEIAAFADIGEFMDRPVRTYSSGMYVRLAFAVQTLSNPDILIIDEALSVGDFFFQQKCLSHIRTLCDNGMTLLYVSHDTNTVRDFCSRAIYLKAGQLKFFGETRSAMCQYFEKRNSHGQLGLSSIDKVTPAASNVYGAILEDYIWIAPPSTKGTIGGQLMAVGLYDADGNPSTNFRLGSTMLVRVIYLPAIEIPTHVVIDLSNKYNQIVTSLGSSRLRLTPPLTPQNQAIMFEMQVTLLLEAGSYSIVVNLAHIDAPNRGEKIDSSESIGPINVFWDYESESAPFLGMIGLPSSGLFKTSTTT